MGWVKKIVKNGRGLLGRAVRDQNFSKTKTPD